MKKNILFTAVLFLLAFIAHSQPYSINWYTIDGGGGTSSGGTYSASGTIGQHDAGGPMSGGSYTVTGGFWSLLVVPTPGAPRLKIILTATNTAVVIWPSPSSGWNLQQNSEPSAVNWVTPSEAINDDGTNKFIIVNPPAANRFYRLAKP